MKRRSFLHLVAAAVGVPFVRRPEPPAPVELFVPRPLETRIVRMGEWRLSADGMTWECEWYGPNLKNMGQLR